MFGLLGGRKAAATLLVVGIGVGMTLYRGDVPPNLLTLLGWIFSAFVVGNVVADMAKRPSVAISEAPSVSVEQLERIEGGLAAVQAGTQALVEYAAQSKQMTDSIVKSRAAQNRQAASGFNPGE